jgi:hypothetical protein
VSCCLTSNGEGLLEYTLSDPFNDGLGPSDDMPILWAAGLADPTGEVRSKVTRSDVRLLLSLVMVGREGRAVLVDVGSFLASLDCERGTTSIIATTIRSPLFMECGRSG